MSPAQTNVVRCHMSHVKTMFQVSLVPTPQHHHHLANVVTAGIEAKYTFNINNIKSNIEHTMV